MLDDEENGNLQSEQFQEQMDVLKQGTRWCEFKSGRRHSFKPPSHDNLLAINGKVSGELLLTIIDRSIVSSIVLTTV